MIHCLLDGTHKMVVVTVYSMGLSFLHVSDQVCAENTLTQNRRTPTHTQPIFERDSEPFRRMMKVVMKNCVEKMAVDLSRSSLNNKK